LTIAQTAQSFLRIEKKFEEKQKGVKTKKEPNRDRGGIGTHIIRESGLSL
jgi:hypothetical protein